jgi:glycosyltransferase involved in cell wall biosynthesis
MKEIIHIVLGKANPARMNGVNKVVFELATQQARHGRKVSVWGITNNPVHNYGERDFETRLFTGSRNPFMLPAELKHAIAERKKDAVFHLHGGWIPAFYSLSNVFAKYGVPFVITPHGAYNQVAMKRSQHIKKVYFQLFEKALLTRAAKIHCIGHSEVAGTNCLIPGNKVLLVPYGYESHEHTVTASVPHKKDFVVGFVGRLDIYTKGLDLLLDAFAAFHQLEKDSVLWIIGDSREKNVLEKMIREKNISSSVILWGSRFGEEKETLMRQMDLFAHPSRNEGLPAAVLEASSMGIPVVVTEATNIAGFVTAHESGMGIENENACALSAALFVLKQQWKTDGLMAMKERAQQMVQNAFNWTHIVKKFDQLYL